MAAPGRMKNHKTTAQHNPLRFDQRLVLNRWMLSLFQVDSFEVLAHYLKDPALETLDENNVSRFYTELTLHLFDLPELSKDVLLTYDQHIVAHTAAINARRVQPIRWKYFQYLTLLFSRVPMTGWPDLRDGAVCGAALATTVAPNAS